MSLTDDAMEQVERLFRENVELRQRADTADRALAEMRERIVLALERTSNKRDQDAESYADERSPLLRAQAEALWDAAQMIHDGKEVET